MKIKFITITCEKYHNTRVQSIRDTWGKNQDLIFLSDMNISPDIIGFDYLKKGYENIWMKYVELLKKWTDFTHDWYFFTDDDTFVNVSNVNKLLADYNADDKICMGHAGNLNADCTDDVGRNTGFPKSSLSGDNAVLPIYYVSGGAGFILSRVAFESLCDYMRNTHWNNVPRAYSGDVAFGFWMRNSNIQVVDIVGFWWKQPESLQHDPEQIKNGLTYHYIRPEEMKELHNLTLITYDL